jgi:hypothetical protein
MEAAPRGAVTRLHCVTHPELTEQRIGAFATFNAVGPELIYSMARLGGLSEEMVDVEGLDELPLEPMEVVVAVRGVEVNQPWQLGEVALVPSAHAHALVKPLIEDIPEANESLRVQRVRLRCGLQSASSTPSKLALRRSTLPLRGSPSALDTGWP